MSQSDTLDAVVQATSANDRRRPGRTAIAPALTPVLRDPAGDHAQDELNIYSDLDHDELVVPRSAADAEFEFKLILKIVAIICSVCAFSLIAGV